MKFWKPSCMSKFIFRNMNTISCTLITQHPSKISILRLGNTKTRNENTGNDDSCSTASMETFPRLIRSMGLHHKDKACSLLQLMCKACLAAAVKERREFSPSTPFSHSLRGRRHEATSKVDSAPVPMCQAVSGAQSIMSC